MSLTVNDVSWYSQDYDDINIILNYGNFPNIPLIGTKKGINYNPSLALCQFGYLVLDKPDNPKLLKKINKAWGEIHHHVKAEMGKKNCIAKEPYI